MMHAHVTHKTQFRFVFGPLNLSGKEKKHQSYIFRGFHVQKIAWLCNSEALAIPIIPPSINKDF